MNVLDTIGSVPGYRVSGVHAGLKKNRALDFALITSDRPCVMACVFTTNRVKAAPVLWNMERFERNPDGIRALAINTVSANACTGEQGMFNARRMAEMVAEQTETLPHQVLVMSTGVIGQPLPMDKIASGAQLAARSLGDHWHDAAVAIMTTDTKPKLASVRVESRHGAYTIAGIAKGSGMIAPNMATMLTALVTDVLLSPQVAQTALTVAANHSFNRIVVDGDTSTNDMAVLLANGASGIELTTEEDIAEFQRALLALSIELAQKVVRDGEGVTKFITLRVQSAADDACAVKIARAIATSTLVKTAFFGQDANWGRIIAAAGRAGVPFDADRARLWFAIGNQPQNPGLLLFENGQPTDYDEGDAALIMEASDVTVTLECNLGAGITTVWTCDLSHDYVTINGDYRT